MAFNVERRGVLKLMQGQRRSFEQLDRGQLGAAALELRHGNVRGSKLPDRRHLEHHLGEGGGSRAPPRRWEEGVCYQYLEVLISNRVTTRLL